MEKRILEEINRVREIMGVKLISEQPAPKTKPRTIGGILANALVSGVQNLNADQIKKKIATEYTALGKAKTTQEAKKVAEEIANAAKKTGGVSTKEFIEVISKHFTAEERIALVRNIARTSPEVSDKFIVAIIKDNKRVYDKFVEMVNGGKKLKDKSTKEYIEKLVNLNPKKYDVSTLEKIYSDIENGTFKYADDAGISVPNSTNISQKLKFNFDEGELSRIRDNDKAIEVPEGAVKDFLTQEYRRFKKLSPEQQKKLVDQVIAETSNWFDSTMSKTGAEQNFQNVQDLFDSPKIGPDEKMKLVKEAINKINPSLGPLQNALDWFVNYLIGYNARTGQNILENGNWKKALKGWMLINAIYAVGMSIGNYVVTADEDPDTLGDNALKIFWNRTDAMGFLTRLVPIPALLRAILEVATKKAIEYKPNRKPSAEEVLVKFKEGATKKDVTERPDYEKQKELFEPFKDVSVWVVKGSEDLGVWYFDPKKGENGELVAVFDPNYTPPKITGTLTDEQILELWKQKYSDGVKKKDGKYYINKDATVDYEFDPETKTFK